MNYQWRVTKYNPDFRDKNGYYTLIEEWICPSEIGEIINGKEFTLDDYLRVETAYINAVIRFLEDSEVNSLRILGLEKTDISKEDKSSVLYEPEFDQVVLKEDLKVNKNEIRLICKMILRNFLWCKLYSKDHFFVHFGWDYYMYIGSYINCPSAIEFARNNGLFVEESISPHFFSEEETTRFIRWNEIGEEFILDEEELIDVPLEEYRRMFNLSAEHPVTGLFELTQKEQEFFQKFLKHKMDFTKYEYSFSGEY